MNHKKLKRNMLPAGNPKKFPCPVCQGKGEDPRLAGVACKECIGKGEVTESQFLRYAETTMYNSKPNTLNTPFADFFRGKR